MSNEPTRKKPCVDHKGNEYPSKTAMCKAYGLSLSAFLKRMERHNGDIEYALEGPKVEDPLKPGVFYRSTSEMCRTYNIRPEAFKLRRKLGWSIEDALTIPVDQSNSKVNISVTIDGVKYPSIREACKAYGILPITYYQRRHHNWGMEEAICTPVRKRKRSNSSE